MDDPAEPRFIAFEGVRCLAQGPLADVALAVKAAVDRGVEREILIFDAATGHPIEVDTRGTADEVLARLASDAAPPQPPRRPGRPKLGVVAREVTLLPRHWDWLGAEPGGASVTIRRLVDQARNAEGRHGNLRKGREAAYRFMSAMAGNLPGFEEASRALFAGRRDQFIARIEVWPPDIRRHAAILAEGSFPAAEAPRAAI